MVVHECWWVCHQNFDHSKNSQGFIEHFGPPERSFWKILVQFENFGSIKCMSNARKYLSGWGIERCEGLTFLGSVAEWLLFHLLFLLCVSLKACLHATPFYSRHEGVIVSY